MLDLVIEARRRDLGGFEVGRILPFAQRRMVGPFIFFDHMGPVALPPNVPRSTDVRPHPHIGLSTVTYLFKGEITHRDSTGIEQVIRPGEVNWMTAGRGITHSERFDTLRQRGGTVHGIQAWVALPEQDEETDPIFAHHGAEDLPAFGDKGFGARLIAGQAFGLTNPIKTLSPLVYIHAELRAGGTMRTPNEYAEEAAYVAKAGSRSKGVPTAPVRCWSRGRAARHDGGHRAGDGDDPRRRAAGRAPHLVEFRLVHKERIDQAAADWRAGRMTLPQLDNQELIPLPEMPQAKPEPMS